MMKNKHTDITDAQRAARSQNAAKATSAREEARAARRAEAAAELSAAGVPRYEVSEARLMAAKAKLAEIDLAERSGELVSVAEAEDRWASTVTVIKTKVLGVPTRLAQRMPGLAAEVVPLVEELLREALEEVADSDGNAVDE